MNTAVNVNVVHESEAQRQHLETHARERWRACAALADLTLGCQLARGRPRH